MCRNHSVHGFGHDKVTSVAALHMVLLDHLMWETTEKRCLPR